MRGEKGCKKIMNREGPPVVCRMICKTMNWRGEEGGIKGRRY